MKVEGRGDSESRGRERKKGDERRKLFYDIIKSFCFYNSEQLICALNSEFFDKDIFDDVGKKL
jgi:hypothetical protein